MKTLKNNVILYDQDCPLCNAYTGTFVKCGMLDTNGRTPFNAAGAGLLNLVDVQRAKNEIALVDTTTQEVSYGIDSLIKVFSHQKPLLNTLLKYKPFYIIAKSFYSLVSYNRKLIAPSKTMYQPNDCTPSFNFFYRLVYLCITAIITGLVLNAFMRPLLQSFSLPTGNLQELCIVSGQLIFQGIIIAFVNKKRTMDYLGNMMTVSFIGALLLLPVLLLRNFIHLGATASIIWLAGVVFIMLILHIKRCKKLGLNYTMTITWIVYRILILLVLFNLL